MQFLVRFKYECREVCGLLEVSQRLVTPSSVHVVALGVTESIGPWILNYTLSPSLSLSA